MASYQNPYVDNQRRTGGPQMNGSQGAQTPASMQNAASQQKPAKGPYDAFGNLSAAWTNTLNQYMQSRRLDNPDDVGMIDPTMPRGAVPPPTTVPPPAPPSPTVPPPDGTVPPPQDPMGGGRRRSGGMPGTGGDPAAGVPPPINPPQPQAPVPTPQDYQRNVEGTYGVSLAEIERMGGNADQYGTFMRWIGDGMSKYGTEAMRPYVEQIRRAPGVISEYHSDMEAAQRNGVTGIHFVDWLANHRMGYSSPLAGQMGQGSADAAARWAQIKNSSSVVTGVPPPTPNQPQTPPPAGGSGTWRGGVFVPTSTTAPPPGAPPPGAQPPATTPSPTSPTAPPVTAPPSVTPPVAPPIPQDFDPTVLREANVDYLDPVYRDAMDEVRRQMMQAGSITGAINSGGFGAMMNDELTPLANQFAAQKGQLQYQAQQAQADRILDRYKFDKAQDLDRFIAENKNELDRYGIDQNVLLQRWVQENRAQLEREGLDVQKWIAEMQAKYGLQGAQIQANAAGAAAQASAGAARYNADLDYQMAMARLGYDYWNSAQGYSYDDLFNQRGYDLGVLGINRDVYGMDQAQWRYLIDMMYRQSPDARLQMVNLPGMMPY